MNRWMLMTLAAILTAGVGCAAADDPASPGTPSSGSVQEEVEMNVLTRGSYGRLAEGSEGRRRAPFVEVATSREALEALWRQYVSEQDPVPEVDLDDTVAVFLLMPQQNTGGYGIEPLGVKVEDGTIRIDATLHQPGQDAITTQALTAPFAVLAIEGASAASKVEWINQDRLLATTQID